MTPTHHHGPGLNLRGQPTWDPTTRTLRLSGSSVSDYCRCPFRFMLTRLMHMERVGADSLNLPAVMGKSLHAAAAAYHLGQDTTAQFAAIIAAWKDVTIPAEEWLNSGYATRIWQQYLPVAQADAWEVATTPSGPVVEYGFDLDMGLAVSPSDQPFHLRWSGFVDLGIIHTLSGRTHRTVVDHKFTQRESDLPRLRARYERSRAIISYLWALEQITGEEWDGTMVNEVVFRNPTSKETARSKPRFEAGEGHRLFVPFSAVKKAEWEQELRQIAGEIVHRIDTSSTTVGPRAFPRFDTACAFPSICPFHSACAMDNLTDTLDIILHSCDYRTRSTSTGSESEPDDQEQA